MIKIIIKSKRSNLNYYQTKIINKSQLTSSQKNQNNSILYFNSSSNIILDIKRYETVSFEKISRIPKQRTLVSKYTNQRSYRLS